MDIYLLDPECQGLFGEQEQNYGVLRQHSDSMKIDTKQDKYWFEMEVGGCLGIQKYAVPNLYCDKELHQLFDTSKSETQNILFGQTLNTHRRSIFSAGPIPSFLADFVKALENFQKQFDFVSSEHSLVLSYLPSGVANTYFLPPMVQEEPYFCSVSILSGGSLAFRSELMDRNKVVTRDIFYSGLDGTYCSKKEISDSKSFTLHLAPQDLIFFDTNFSRNFRRIIVPFKNTPYCILASMYSW